MPRGPSYKVATQASRKSQSRSSGSTNTSARQARIGTTAMRSGEGLKALTIGKRKKKKKKK